MAEQSPRKVSQQHTLDKDMPRFHRTMLRVKDPKISVHFYEINFSMRLIHWMRFDKRGYSVYFLERQREGHTSPACSLELTSADCERYLLAMNSTALELRHVHGTESDPDFKGYWNGNIGKDASGELHAEMPAARGFGHIAFNVDDVYKACDKLDANGVRFQKKPNEGRMRGLAFALDPDGYWIEICSRTRKLHWPEYQNLSQTMLRVKDGPTSVEFYTKHLGMTLLRKSDFKRWRFSLYFLASMEAEEINLARQENAIRRKRKRSRSSSSSSSSSSSDSGLPSPSSLWNPVLELTWNHGTEADQDFHVHNGNSEPYGFGHLGFLVSNLDRTCETMQDAGVKFKDMPQKSGTASLYDPDGYVIELFDRAGSLSDRGDIG